MDMMKKDKNIYKPSTSDKYLLIKLLKEIKITDENKGVIGALLHRSRSEGNHRVFQFQNFNIHDWCRNKDSKKTTDDFALVKTEEDLINIFKDLKTVKVFVKMINDEILIELSNKQ